MVAKPPFNWNIHSQTVWNQVCREIRQAEKNFKLLRVQNVFRKWQLLPKRQINDSEMSCLELKMNCQLCFGTSKTFGNILSLVVWFTFLFRFLPSFQHQSCHVSVWTAGSTKTKCSRSLVCFLRDCPCTFFASYWNISTFDCQKIGGVCYWYEEETWETLTASIKRKYPGVLDFAFHGYGE